MKFSETLYICHVEGLSCQDNVQGVWVWLKALFKIQSSSREKRQILSHEFSKSRRTAA